MKEILINLAINELKFKSKVLYNKAYKYSNSEDIRYYLWMCELQKYILDNHMIKISISHKINIDKWDFIVADLYLGGMEYIKYYREYYIKNPDRRYDSNELALEAGLLEAVKLLINK